MTGGCDNKAADARARPAGPDTTGPIAELCRCTAIADDLVRRWQQLADAAIEPNIFYHPALLIPALQQFCGEPRTRLFLLWQGKAGDSPLAGLLPIGPRDRFGHWPIPHVQNWSHHNSFLGSPLVLPGHEARFWEQLFAALDRSGWPGFLHLNGLVSDGPLALALQSVAQRQRRRCDMVYQEARALLSGSTDPAAYYAAAVRSKKRKELRRQHHRLAELGALGVERRDDDAELSAWIDEFLALEMRGWKGQAGSALRCDPRTERFFREALTHAARAGTLQRLALRLDGQAIAMLVNFRCPPGSFSFKTAYDENYARYSPGVLLQIANLDILHDPMVRWMDSCAAQDHPMIDTLWTGRRPIGRYSIALHGLSRGLMFRAVRTGEQLMDRIKRRPPMGGLAAEHAR